MKAQIINFNDWIQITEIASLKKELESLLVSSGYTIVNYAEHRFSPHGFTSVWLLAESHLALHTFPEENKSYIELSSCNKLMSNKFINNYKKWKSIFEPHFRNNLHT